MSRPSRWWLAVAISLGCEPNQLEAVGAPGGVYAPEMGCTLDQAGGAACPTGAQFAFEAADPGGFVSGSTAPKVSNVRVTCQRSYCGTGSLAFHATYRYAAGETDPPRLGEIRYVLPQPVDLYGKFVFANVLVEPQNTPFNAQLAVIHRGIFRRIDDGPLRNSRGWNVVGGIASQANPLWAADLGAITALPVTELRIQVYLSTPVKSGGDTWSGEIYVDDVGWRER